MPNIVFNENTYEAKEQESVLDCLLRHDLEIPHGCKAGACQACMMHTHDKSVPPASQTGLSNNLKEQGFFLSCSCIPSEDLYVSLEQAIPRLQATVISIDKLNASVLRLRLNKSLHYRSGQYLNIWVNETAVRSYSLASVDELDDFIELHIKYYQDGLFSAWAWNTLKTNDILHIQGPIGTCFYTKSDPTQPLLFAGIGTGLAPLYGILRDALAQDHTGQIDLMIGAKNKDDFYLQEELLNLAKRHTNIQVHFLAQADTDIYEFAKTTHPSTKGMQIYLCGSESFVRKMKKQCFLAGAKMTDIHADAFLPSA